MQHMSRGRTIANWRVQLLVDWPKHSGQQRVQPFLELLPVRLPWPQSRGGVSADFVFIWLSQIDMRPGNDDNLAHGCAPV